MWPGVFRPIITSVILPHHTRPRSRGVRSTQWYRPGTWRRRSVRCADTCGRLSWSMLTSGEVQMIDTGNLIKYFRTCDPVYDESCSTKYEQSCHYKQKCPPHSRSGSSYCKKVKYCSRKPKTTCTPVQRSECSMKTFRSPKQVTNTFTI